MTQQQRKWLDFPLRKATSLHKTPSYKALWNFVHQIDVEAFATCLNHWLGTHIGTLPRALALDGKWVRERALSLCLSEHESGAPVAVGFARAGDGGPEAKREGEQTVAKRFYKEVDLHNAVVTGDALFCDQHQARAIIEGGGDYLFQIKNENRQAWKAAVAQAECPPLFVHTETPDIGHGRFDQRTVSVHAIDPVETGLPGVRSLSVTQRTRTFDPEEVPELSYYLGSIPPSEGGAISFARLIRGHWAGCENRNHWVRDHCMREDRTRLGSYEANGVLSALRVCLLVIKSILYQACSWPEITERCQHNPGIAAAAILKLHAK